jgi:hypothetical protein
MAADVIGFSAAALLHDRPDRLAVIRNVEPVPDVPPVPVNGEGFPLQGVEDNQRDQFFRELVGTVVV